MAAEWNVDVNNLVQTIIQHSAFRETIISIKTATNQEQSTNIVLSTPAEIPERERGHRVIKLLWATARLLVVTRVSLISCRRWVLLSVPGVGEQDKNSG